MFSTLFRYIKIGEYCILFMTSHDLTGYLCASRNGDPSIPRFYYCDIVGDVLYFSRLFHGCMVFHAGSGRARNHLWVSGYFPLCGLCLLVLGVGRHNADKALRKTLTREDNRRLISSETFWIMATFPFIYGAL
jgi:hypothetical protein